MKLNYWKQRIGDFYENKFGNSWSIQDRILSLVSQCTCLAERIQFRQGLRKVDKQHGTDQVLVASIFLDTFVLAKLLNVDIDIALEEAMRQVAECQR